MDKREADRDISSKLRELRRARGLTVDTLAKKMGENSQKVGRIERGTRSITLDYLVKVSKALETPVELFLEKNTRADVKVLTTVSSNILNDIIILIEEYHNKNPIEAHKKALMISKIYELALRFPEENRKIVLSSFFEFIRCL